jgi:hypothetical protein
MYFALVVGEKWFMENLTIIFLLVPEKTQLRALYG